MRKLPLHYQIMIGLILGVIWALFSSYVGLSEFTLNWIDPFGDIFINLLKLIAVPLVLFSIIKGISSLPDASNLGRIGSKTLLAYLSTTLFATLIGLLLVNSIKPGSLINEEQRIINRINYELWCNDSGVEIKDGVSFLKNPSYSQLALKERAKNKSGGGNEFLVDKIDFAEKTKKKKPLDFLVDIIPSNIFLSLNDNSLMLQVIFFAIFFGVALLYIDKKKGSVISGFVDGGCEVFIKMVGMVMKGAPFFVFALLAGKVSEIAGDNPANVIEVFKGLGWYCLVVVAGLGFLALLFYPAIIGLFVKQIPLKTFYRGIAPAQTLAFSSSSSAATLPVTMECVSKNLGVSNKITSFVLPVGATVNMDGTSLYQAIAVIFLAQFHMVELTIMQQVIIVLTATLASIGAAAVPSAGLIMLIIVLGSVGLNPAWIAIIFPVDRILDMCRTVVNVTGDATVASVVASWENEIGSENR